MSKLNNTFSLHRYATAFALATLVSSSALAKEPRVSEETKAGLLGVSVFTGASIAGAIAAGPVGFFAGALTGVYVGEKGIAHAQSKQELRAAETTLADLRNQAEEREQKLAQLEKSAAARLEFMVLFPTGQDQLSRQDINRITSLANYMKNNPDLRVRLDGHADPRGTDEYNNVLSEERALSVVKALTERGINATRIDHYAHGSSLSSAYNGDLEAYALERKVRIEVYSTAETQEVAVTE